MSVVRAPKAKELLVTKLVIYHLTFFIWSSGSAKGALVTSSHSCAGPMKSVPPRGKRVVSLAVIHAADRGMSFYKGNK